MAVIAGKSLKVSVATTKGGSYNEIDGIRNISFGPKLDILDITNFKQTSGSDDRAGAKVRSTGLSDADLSLSGDYIPGDTDGQAVLLSHGPGGASAGTSLWIKLLPTGVAASGWILEVLVGSWSGPWSTDQNEGVTYPLTVISKIQADA